MPISAYKPRGASGDDLPVDLQLDLLVDAELAEQPRAALLRSLDETPAQWRDLALRFLQRQTEHEAARQLLAGGRLAPVDLAETPIVYRFPGRWIRSFRVRTAAAALLIAAASAVLTMLAVRTHDTGMTAGGIPVQPVIYKGSLPLGNLGDGNGTMQVEVPVTPDSGASSGNWFATDSGGEPAQRRWVVIQPDGQGDAVVIPVNALSTKIY